MVSASRTISMAVAFRSLGNTRAALFIEGRWRWEREEKSFRGKGNTESSCPVLFTLNLVLVFKGKRAIIGWRMAKASTHWPKESE